jgi:hypothetical protein
MPTPEWPTPSLSPTAIETAKEGKTGGRRFTTFRVAAKAKIVTEIWGAWEKAWKRVQVAAALLVEQGQGQASQPAPGGGARGAAAMVK